MNHEHDAKSETIHARNNNKKVEKKKTKIVLFLMIYLWFSQWNFALQSFKSKRFRFAIFKQKEETFFYNTKSFFFFVYWKLLTPT